MFPVIQNGTRSQMPIRMELLMDVARGPFLLA